MESRQGKEAAKIIADLKTKYKDDQPKADSSTSIKAALRSEKAGKRGIYIRVTIDRQLEYFPTGYYVDENDFDEKAGTVKGKESHKDKINSYIRYLIKELDEVLTELKKSGEVVSVDNFKRHYLKRYKRDLCFADYFKMALEEKKISIEPTTYEVYSRLLTKINEYAPDLSSETCDYSNF